MRIDHGAALRLRQIVLNEDSLRKRGQKNVDGAAEESREVKGRKFVFTDTRGELK